MTGTLNSDLTFSSIFKPSSSPGPLNDEMELRFALSKDPLKIQLIFKFDVVFENFSATVITIDSDSKTLTPPMRVIGS